MKARLSDEEISKGVIKLWNFQYRNPDSSAKTNKEEPLQLSPYPVEHQAPENLNHLCKLLSDLDRLLIYLDQHDKKPFDAIYPCPECGELHSWQLLSGLLNFIIGHGVRPVMPGSILDAVSQLEIKPKGGLIVDF